MTNTKFHKLQFSKKMVKAGFTKQQAEGQAEALIEIIDNNLATKTDVSLVHKDIKIIEERIANIDKSTNKLVWTLVFISSIVAILVTFHK
jgi:hypothetical protein